jgi:hypothetical protein
MNIDDTNVDDITLSIASLEARCKEYELLIRRLVHVCRLLNIDSRCRQELKIARTHFPTNNIPRDRDVLIQEIEAERKYSLELSEENAILRRKLTHALGVLMAQIHKPDNRGFNNRSELNSLRTEVQHLRDLLLLSSKSFGESSGASPCHTELIKHDSISSNPVTPPRSPECGHPDDLKFQIKNDHAAMSFKGNESSSGQEPTIHDIMDVGPPMSPKGQASVKRDMSPDETEAERIDSEEIRVSYREVDNDLGEPHSS